MPITKASLDMQMQVVIRQVSEPGEQVIASVYCASGLSPWLMRQISYLGMPFYTNYYVTLTDRRVIFHEMTKMANHVKSVAFIDPREAVAITKVKRKSLWSSLRYSSPSTAKPIRLNIHRNRRPAMDTIVAHLGAAPDA
jgi:hypothetical protein